jgi:light-regulated signal transduction histidine kinase (bacteriophytochrome)
VSDVDRERLRAEALQDLLTWQENRHADLLVDAQRQLAQAAEDVRHATQTNSVMLETQNKNLHRTQRAMVNVIEDLREAREALAWKVELRTRELRVANVKLEQRNRDLEEFVYIASHDLQEPLRTVVGYLQMVERRYRSQLGAEADEFIEFAIEGAQRMQALLESLLFYSRVASKERRFERVELDDALTEALKNLALSIEETGARIERASLPAIDGDHVQLVQMFQNLISNALKFCGDERPRIFVSATTSAEFRIVHVRDEGIGFNPKYVDRIFKLFRRLRRDTPGTGIGLAVCKKIAERHGAAIEATSSPGAGSTFSVLFPVISAKVP